MHRVPSIDTNQDYRNVKHYNNYERMIDITIILFCITTIIGVIFIQQFPSEFAGELGRNKRFLVLTPMLIGAYGFLIVTIEKIVKFFRTRSIENKTAQPIKTVSPPAYDNNSFSFQKNGQ